MLKIENIYILNVGAKMLMKTLSIEACFLSLTGIIFTNASKTATKSGIVDLLLIITSDPLIYRAWGRHLEHGRLCDGFSLIHIMIFCMLPKYF